MNTSLSCGAESGSQNAAARRAAGASETASRCSQIGIAVRNELKPLRREGQIGFDQPLEFQQRLVVEHDVVEFVALEAGVLKAIANRVVRESRRRASCA